MIRHRDWQFIYRRVEEIKNPIPWASSVAWACVGVAPSALLSFLGWLAAYDVLPPSQQTRLAWVAPAIAALGIFAVALCIICFVMDREVEGIRQRDKTRVLEEMDHFYEPHRLREGDTA